MKDYGPLIAAVHALLTVVKPLNLRGVTYAVERVERELEKVK
jgi:hypothetical protein